MSKPQVRHLFLDYKILYYGNQILRYTSPSQTIYANVGTFGNNCKNYCKSGSGGESKLSANFVAWGTTIPQLLIGRGIARIGDGTVFIVLNPPLTHLYGLNRMLESKLEKKLLQNLNKKKEKLKIEHRINRKKGTSRVCTHTEPDDRITTDQTVIEIDKKHPLQSRIPNWKYIKMSRRENTDGDSTHRPVVIKGNIKNTLLRKYQLRKLKNYSKTYIKLIKKVEIIKSQNKHIRLVVLKSVNRSKEVLLTFKSKQNLIGKYAGFWIKGRECIALTDKLVRMAMVKRAMGKPDAIAIKEAQAYNPRH